MSGRTDSWVRLAAASVGYFALVFGAGFLFGPIRVFWLEPRVGKTFAVLCEAPPLVAVMVLTARWLPRKLAVSRDHGSLATIGLAALVLQQIADVSLGAAVRGLTLTEQLDNFATPQGGVYAVLLLLFAAMPLLMNSRSSSIGHSPQ